MKLMYALEYLMSSIIAPILQMVKQNLVIICDIAYMAASSLFSRDPIPCIPLSKPEHPWLATHRVTEPYLTLLPHHNQWGQREHLPKLS